MYMEREREREREGERERGRERECMCVCERERNGGRGGSGARRYTSIVHALSSTKLRVISNIALYGVMFKWRSDHGVPYFRPKVFFFFLFVLLVPRVE